MKSLKSFKEYLSDIYDEPVIDPNNDWNQYEIIDIESQTVLVFRPLQANKIFNKNNISAKVNILEPLKEKTIIINNTKQVIPQQPENYGINIPIMSELSNRFIRDKPSIYNTHIHLYLKKNQKTDQNPDQNPDQKIDKKTDQKIDENPDQKIANKLYIVAVLCIYVSINRWLI